VPDHGGTQWGSAQAKDCDSLRRNQSSRAVKDKGRYLSYGIEAVNWCKAEELHKPVDMNIVIELP
jgi:hypothetical protein